MNPTDNQKYKTWIMISGPYGTGAKSDQDREVNLSLLNANAMEVLRKGYVPIIGVNCALPLTLAAAKEDYDQIMMPLSMALIERCDACLRIGGASKGADQEMNEFIRSGKPVYYSLADIPAISNED